MIAFTDIISMTAIIAAFGVVIAIWIVGMMIWLYQRSKHAKKVEHRLGLHDETEQAEGTRTLRLWHDGQEVTTTVTDKKIKQSFKDRLDKVFRNAGYRSPTKTILLGLSGWTLMASVVTLALFQHLTGSIVAGIVVVFAFWIIVKRRIYNRTSLFERQFVEAIGLASRSLHAGHPLTGAFRLISEEVDAPVGNLFEDICQQQALGVSLEKALRNTARRSDSSDMKMFTTCVVMQLRSGGNLADMMERLAEVIRDRIRLSRRVKVLTAQTQMSKTFLLVLPVGIFLFLYFFNPRYLEPLYTTSTGYMLLGLAAGGMLLGWWIMNKMARIQY